MDERMKNERHAPNDELEPDKERPGSKPVPPSPSAEEIEQQVEEEDRFQATDN